MADRKATTDAPGTAGATPTTAGTKNEVERDYETLKRDFTKLRTDVADLMQTMVGASKATAGEQRDRMYAETERRMHQLSEGAHRARLYGHKGVGEAEDYIERNPFSSVAIAFIIGLITGCLWRR